MIHIIVSVIFIAVIIFFAFLLTVLAVLMIASTMAVKQEGEEQELILPPHGPDSASFKGGA